MTGDPALLYALTALAAVTMLSLALLRAWHGWLALRRVQLEAGAGGAGGLDVSGLRARVKRLEAIASGLDG
ncbi:MAG: hypothetical protein JO013_04205 [Alphaproteobacteria bacterium]|nr:hypothetical protein [Alphaproteobacteria bacterium]